MMQSQLEEPLLSSPFLDPLEGGFVDNDNDEQSDEIPNDEPPPNNNTASSNTTNKASSLFGRFTLLSCAIMYASLNVCFRYLYSLPKPPSVSSLMTVRGWVTFVGFFPLTMFRTNKQPSASSLLTSSSSLSIPSTSQEADDVISDDTNNIVSSDNIAEEDNSINNNINENNNNNVTSGSSSPSTSLYRVALELCLWNYSSQILCNFGLLYIPSARASFLGQVTVVIVPLLEYFCFGGQQLSQIVLLGCFTSFFGLGCLSYEDVFATGSSKSDESNDGSSDSKNSDSSNSNMGFGDCLVLVGTVCWSLYILRISSTAKFYDKIQLQAWKNFYLAIGYTVWYLVEIVWEHLSTSSVVGDHDDGVEQGNEATTTHGFLSVALSAVATKVVTSWYQNPHAWFVIIYSAIGPGTSADILQQYGQERVPATESNLILSMEPVFTTIMGRLLLDEETSILDKIGGGFLVLGAIIAST